LVFLILMAALLANVGAARRNGQAASETQVLSPDGAVQLKVFVQEEAEEGKYLR